MEALGFDLRAEAVLATLTEDVLKSSEIEGEILDKDHVRSSIARRLGMDIGALAPADRQIEGVVEMMLDALWGHPCVHAFLGWTSFKWATGWPARCFNQPIFSCHIT
jgi:Fic family protein